MLKHIYDTKKNLILQWYFDTYPQIPPVVDKKYAHHYILCLTCRQILWIIYFGGKRYKHGVWITY
jgi:hypothetical protein